MSNHVLPSREILQRLQDYKKTTIRDVSNKIYDKLSNHNQAGAIAILRDQFSKRLSQYLRSHNISDAKSLLPHFKKRLADIVVDMDDSNLDLSKIEAITHQIQVIKNDTVIWFDMNDLTLMNENDVLSIFHHLKENELS